MITRQMQVSRLSARAVGYLRQWLLSQHKHASAASPAACHFDQRTMKCGWQRVPCSGPPRRDGE
jgi:hypothetical protein